MQKALDECKRVLRTGGTFVFMVYYAYSYRRFYQSTFETLGYLFGEFCGYRGVVGQSARERAGGL